MGTALLGAFAPSGAVPIALPAPAINIRAPFPAGERLSPPWHPAWPCPAPPRHRPRVLGWVSPGRAGLPLPAD